MMLKTVFVVSIVCSGALSGKVHATPMEACEMRAAILGSVAQERDKGVDRKKVKRLIVEKLGKNASMSGYIDLVYDRMKDMPPKDVAELIKYACARE